MNGRMIHDKAGNTFLSPYSGRKDEYINSISRPGLNMLLLDEAEKMPNVKIIFNHACENVDLENASATFKDFNTKEEVSISADAIFGTDGAGSVVRKSMFENHKFLFSFSQQWLSHGYKELEIPAAQNGEFRTYKNALHIWPRGEDMLIALPNLDGSFTVTATATGKKIAEKYDLENMRIERPDRWDGYWRILSFDIPANKKLARQTLLGKLKDLGFIMLQKSIWIHPFDCQKELAVISKAFEVEPYVNFIVAKELDKSYKVRKEFETKNQIQLDSIELKRS